MDVIEDRGDTFDLVQQGMMGVAQTIPALASYPYTIACKTGSPQRSESYYAGSTRKHYTNATMIAYGPVEDPQIAIGIVVEYGGAGTRTGQLVADIFDAYFAMQNGTPDGGRTRDRRPGGRRSEDRGCGRRRRSR